MAKPRRRAPIASSLCGSVPCCLGFRNSIALHSGVKARNLAFAILPPPFSHHRRYVTRACRMLTLGLVHRTLPAFLCCLPSVCLCVFVPVCPRFLRRASLPGAARLPFRRSTPPVSSESPRPPSDASKCGVLLSCCYGYPRPSD